MHAFFAPGMGGADVGETTSWDELATRYGEGATVWVDLGPECEEAAHALTVTFKLHPLVIEDIWADRALPKIEDFDDYLFVLVHGVSPDAKSDHFDVEEIDLVLGARFLLTHHHDCRAVKAAREDVMRSAKLLKKGPAWVMHDVLDHLVDHYLPVLEEFDTTIEQIEDDVMAKAGTPGGQAVMSRMLAFKRTLLALRRSTIYQREILLRLSRVEFDEIPPEAAHFFRDVFDHFARVTDLVEGHRDLLSGAIEAYLSVQSNRLNEIMKTLTLMSTVMLPLTFIAGVYGMNFKVMPELEWHAGYPYALGLMATTAVVILAWFRHRRWL